MESGALENPRKFLFLFFVLNSKSFHSTTADRGGEFLAPSSSLSRYSTHSHTHTFCCVHYKTGTPGPATVAFRLCRSRSAVCCCRALRAGSAIISNGIHFQNRYNIIIKPSCVAKFLHFAVSCAIVLVVSSR